MMKLYSVPHSPYASRVRIQVYANDLPIEICEPTGGLGSDTFKAMSPTGRVPMLETDTGNLVESFAIMEYLEEAFPQSSLMPTDGAQRAWVRAVSRYADIDIAKALFPLFLELKLKSGDKEALAANMAALKQTLQTLEGFMLEQYRSEAGKLDLADCALAPILFYVTTVPPIFGEQDILGGLPQVQAWWQWAGEQPVIARVLDEMAVGLKAMLGQG